MQPNLLPWIDGLWVAFVAIWLVAAIKTKRAARRISGWPRYGQIGLMTAGVILLFDQRLSAGWLDARAVPNPAAFAWTGAAMTAVGIVFAVWARFELGQNWSSQITVKEGHELVRRGPYALVRHPIYSGMLLALFGTAVCVGRFRGLFAFALFTAAFWLKARAEEAVMLEQFAEEYRRYRTEVKALIPFVF